MRGNTLLRLRAALPVHALLVSALFSACNADAGTSTGNPAPKDGDDAGPPREVDNGGNGDGLAGAGYCRAGEKTPLALDEDSPLGFSPDDILAFAAGTHEDTIRWNAQRAVEYGPESGQGAITITVAPLGTAHHVEPAPPGGAGVDTGGALPAIDIDSMCTSWIEIDVDVTIETEGGALDERWRGVLRAHTPITTSLYASWKPEDLGGSFEAHGIGSLEGFTLGGTQLAVRLSPYGMSGSFHAWLKGPDTGGDQAAVGGGEPLATLGAASCEGDAFAIGANDVIEGVTVQDALDLLAEHAQIDVTWQDDATTTSSFAFAPATGGGCVLLDNQGPGELTLVIDGTVSMTSDDGRLDGMFSGRFEAHLEDGAIARVAFHPDGKMMSNVALGGAYYGFPDIDLSPYDAAGTTLDITVTSAGVEGTITLIAYTFNEDCEQPVPDEPEGGGGSSAPGCSGAAPTELATGVLD